MASTIEAILDYGSSLRDLTVGIKRDKNFFQGFFFGEVLFHNWILQFKMTHKKLKKNDINVDLEDDRVVSSTVL